MGDIDQCWLCTLYFVKSEQIMHYLSTYYRVSNSIVNTNTQASISKSGETCCIRSATYFFWSFMSMTSTESTERGANKLETFNLSFRLISIRLVSCQWNILFLKWNRKWKLVFPHYMNSLISIVFMIKLYRLSYKFFLLQFFTFPDQ